MSNTPFHPHATDAHRILCSQVLKMVFWGCLLSVSVLLGACQQTPSERCENLEALIEAKRTDLSRECSNDLDCFVVEVAPGDYAAVHSFPQDSEHDAIVQSHQTDCETPTPRRKNIFGVRCVEAQTESDEAPLCALTYKGLVVDESAAQDLLEAHCECSTNSECGEDMLCMGNCECLPICEAACQSASACQGWEVLGLGSTLKACVETCSIHRDDPEIEGLNACLVRANTCTEISGCVR